MDVVRFHYSDDWRQRTGDGVAITSTSVTITATKGAIAGTATATESVIWASSQPSIATISNTNLQQGLATGVAPGQTSITPVFAGIVGNATLNVTNATINSNGITISLPSPIVTHGTVVNFAASGTFSDNSKVNLTNQVTWTSSDATVAIINGIGQATTVKAGTAVITASFTQYGTTVTATANLTVN